MEDEIIINVILAGITIFPHLILEGLYRIKNKLIKFVVIFVCFIIFIVSIYTGLIGAALLGLEKSN